MFYQLILVFILIIIIVAIGFLLGGLYFYNFAILRRKKEFMTTDPDLHETKSGVKWISNKEWLFQQKREELKAMSHDGLLLNAIYLPSDSQTDKLVILVHGYNSWSGSMGAFAQYYKEELGYNVLMPDCRGHGKSEGNYLGFGWHDRKDILQWIEHMLQRHGSQCQILLHGVSMGGSTVLMTGGEKLPDNVKCIVSDCAFTSGSGILGYQLKRMFKLPKFPLLEATSLICRLRAGFGLEEASAVQQVLQCEIPILFIHGSADRFVPSEMVHELYEAASCEKQLLMVSDAAHGTSFWKDPAQYRKTLESFLSKYIK